MSTRVDHFEDDTDASSVSDYDSEWTQVSGAEDDSDFPPLTAFSDRSLSRSDTIDGSVDGDVWEGFTEDLHSSQSDVGDPTRSDVDAITSEPETAAQSMGASTSGAVATEDAMINSALDCSVMGTLRASRARSLASSLQGSLSESQSKLRLSFPDPLLRPSDDLDADNAQRIDADLSGEASPCESASDEQSDTFALCASDDTSSVSAEIETLPTLDGSEIVAEDTITATEVPDTALSILSLVLYGSASPSKWQIAEKILKLALGVDSFPATFEQRGSTRLYLLGSVRPIGLIFNAEDVPSYVRVVDRTVVNVEESCAKDSHGEPSLAVVLLPSPLPSVLPEHKFYLPLISPPSLHFGSTFPILSSAFSEQVMNDSAQYAWQRLELPDERLIVLDTERPNTILNVAELELMERSTLEASLQTLFKPPKAAMTNRSPETLRLFANRWYLFAFVAATLLAVTVGGRVHIAGNASKLNLTVNGSGTAAFPESMSKVAVAPATSHAGALMPIQLKDRSLAIRQTQRSAVTSTALKIVTSTSLANAAEPVRSTAGQPRAVHPIEQPEGQRVVGTTFPDTSTPACGCHSADASWPKKLNRVVERHFPKDLIPLSDSTKYAWKKASSPLNALLTPRNTAAERRSAYATGGGFEIGKKAAQEFDKALSSQVMQNSMAIASTVGKALMEVVGHDLKAMYDAIDELLSALARQLEDAGTSLQVAKSFAKNEFVRRNARAKASAKRLRKAGEQAFKAANEQWQVGKREAAKLFEQARKGAKQVKEEASRSRQARRAKREKRRKGKKEATLKSKSAETEKIRAFLEGWNPMRNEKSDRRAEERAEKRDRRRDRKTKQRKVRRHEEGDEGVLQSVMGAVF